MTHLPDSDLRELEGLLAKATPAELWRVHLPAGPQVLVTTAHRNGEQAALDAQLVADILNALPSLIADLREARERIKEFENPTITEADRDWAIRSAKTIFGEDGKQDGDDTAGVAVRAMERAEKAEAELAQALARIKELEGKT